MSLTTDFCGQILFPGDAMVLSLPDDEVHIWIWQPEPDAPASLAEESCLLDAEERQRMAQYRFANDRRRFLLRHQTMRRILSRYTGLEAGSLRFSLNPHGKPRLASDHAPPHIHFSLSHSRQRVAMALTRDRELGADIEDISPRIDPLTMAAGCFASQEIAALRSVPAPQRLETFFRIWTLKEAYIKARGQGLSLPLKSFAVSPGPPPLLLAAPPDTSVHGWQLGQWQIEKESYLAVALPVAPDHPTLRFVIERLHYD